MFCGIKLGTAPFLRFISLDAGMEHPQVENFLLFRILSSATLSKSEFGFRFGLEVHRDGVLETVENLIGGVLEAGVGLMQLAGRFGGELAELIAVGDVGQCSKNEI
jgi:hypothetical protein